VAQSDQKPPKTENKARKRYIIIASIIMGLVLGAGVGGYLSYILMAKWSGLAVGGLFLGSSFMGAMLFGGLTWAGFKIADLFGGFRKATGLEEKLLSESPEPPESPWLSALSPVAQRPVVNVSLNAPVTIAALTWKMETASEAAVEELMKQLEIGRAKPTVIAISVQEKLTPEV